jgi:hypothetical protein
MLASGTKGGERKLVVFDAGDVLDNDFVLSACGHLHCSRPRPLRSPFAAGALALHFEPIGAGAVSRRMHDASRWAQVHTSLTGFYLRDDLQQWIRADRDLTCEGPVVRGD